jgi:tetratricopeptide (TPR) repeat protein
MVSSNPPQRSGRRGGTATGGSSPAGGVQDPASSYEQDQRECLAAAAGAGSQVEACVKFGALAAEAGRWDDAAKALKAALALDPRCSEAYGSLAMIHQRRQDYPQAVDNYLKCLELDGDNLIALLGLFQTCCKMGTFAVIIRYLEIYLGGHPRDVAVLFCLATLYARDGSLEKARGILRGVLDLEPTNTEAERLLGQVEAALSHAPACRQPRG